MLSFTAAEIGSWVAGLFWPFVRIGAMLMAAPIFGARYMPVRLRVGLGLLLSAVLFPVLPPVPAVEPLSGAGLLITAQQVLIGVAMGFILHMVFSAVAQAGEKIAMSMGLGFASMIDPQSGVQTPVVSQHYVVMATLIFLALDGHLAFIEVMVQSFEILPVAVDGLSREGLWQLLLWGSHMFAGAVLIALPAAASLLVVNLAFGVITRAAPQLNIFAVGFPMSLMLGFVLIIVTLPALVPQVTELLVEAVNAMGRVLAGGA